MWHDGWCRSGPANVKRTKNSQPILTAWARRGRGRRRALPGPSPALAPPGATRAAPHRAPRCTAATAARGPSAPWTRRYLRETPQPRFGRKGNGWGGDPLASSKVLKKKTAFETCTFCCCFPLFQIDRLTADLALYTKNLMVLSFAENLSLRGNNHVTKDELYGSVCIFCQNTTDIWQALQ